MTLEIEIGDGPLTFILMLKSLGVGGVEIGVVVEMDPSLTILVSRSNKSGEL